MKCQECDKPATFHITELTEPQPVELHLCEDHAREYLSQSNEQQASPPSLAAALTSHVFQQTAVGQTAQELEELDQQVCPVCGISFYEFRSKGRLGCPHDYTCFQTQLEPLILNIHGDNTHHGKAPQRGAGQSVERTQLIRLRREMKKAVTDEDYELASDLRDKIRRIEQPDE